jgi:predicted CXXCH cytochrome family protein
MGKRNRRAIVWLTGAAAAIMLGACAAGQIAKPLEPKEIMLAGGETMAGTVAFRHARHAGPKDDGGCGSGCAKCHHEVEGAENARACWVCHGREGGEAPRMEEAAHSLCTGCHEERRAAEPSLKIPCSCPDCHAHQERK